MDMRTLEQVEAEIKDAQTRLDKLNKKVAKGKELSATENRNKTLYEKNLNGLLKEKEGLINPVATEPTVTKTVTPTTTAPKPVVDKPTTKPATVSSATSSTEKGLEKVEEKAQDVADEMNDPVLQEKKEEDVVSATGTAAGMADKVDARIQENMPFWFWREAQEMAPTDKAKRGFLIANHILNRFGTALHNIGVAFQNNGGSGGGQMREHGGSFIDRYSQNKFEQVLANRKVKQDSILQRQIDALVAIGASENEARAIQNRLRNSSFWNKYNRLTNEQQVYIQGLLYNDTKGKIKDAALGNFIDQLMEGKNVSLEQAAVNMMAAEGIDNIDEIKSGAKAIGDKVIQWLNWDKPGQ